MKNIQLTLLTLILLSSFASAEFTMKDLFVEGGTKTYKPSKDSSKPSNEKDKNGEKKHTCN